MVITKAGRVYTEEVESAVASVAWIKFRRSSLKVSIDAVMPDNRIRDIDNVQKVLLDALTKAGAWDDDKQIDHLEIIRRRPALPPGKVIVTVSRMARKKKRWLKVHRPKRRKAA